MKVFVTGVKGQLGAECIRELLLRRYQAIGSDIGDTSAVVDYVPLDITDRKAVMWR